MTMFLPSKIKCAICGKESEQQVLLSESVFGYSDLDLRPGPPSRGNVDLKMQRCTSCGYSAPSISEEALRAFGGKDYSKIRKKISKTVHSKSYKNQLTSRSFPKMANSYLCWALILEALGKYDAATNTAIAAAWASDDAKKKLAAKKARLRAVELYNKARKAGQKFSEQRGGDEAVVADLLRRAGKFKEALKFSEQGLKKKPDKFLSKVLNYQKTLIKKRDTKRHTVEEIK